MLRLTRDMVKKRYAAMSSAELLRLDAQKLTPEARELYAEELARAPEPGTEALPARRTGKGKRQIAAALLLCLAMGAGHVSRSLPEGFSMVSGAAVLLPCLLALWILHRR